MRVLVLGGTRFVGAAIVDELVGRGAEVTLFTRGETNPTRFSELDHVRGDRAADLARLGDRRFDVIIDSCGYEEAQVRPSATLAAALDAFYVFVSTASVYRLDRGVEGAVTEEHARMTSTAEPGADGEGYAEGKVRCETALERALGDRLAILRPGLIVGPRDYTDRYPYWVWRLAAGGPVLVPGDGADPAQILDARDLARFAVDLCERAAPGVFNAAGPAHEATFADLVTATAPPGVEPELVWASRAFLDDNDVAPWKDMPCWLPRDHEQAAMLRLDTTRARAAGLRTRPWSETAADTRAWMRAAGREPPLSAGLTAEGERALLERYRRT